MKPYFQFWVCFILLCCLCLSPIFAQEGAAAVQYSMVEISMPQESLEQIYSLGLALDESLRVQTQNNFIFTVPVTAAELSLLQQAGISYRVTIEDLSAYYANRAAAEDTQKLETLRQTFGTEMKYGTMGGFYKIEEAYQVMDALYQKYGNKNLITQKQSIGTSFEGRPIYMVKISDNADNNEAEPQVLYTALTHAREPGGMMTVFYFMYYLLENYGTNQRVTSLVDNRELYFIPVVNPDGYAYNQKNSPTGGGMWRKNRNSKGSVDLNRNYGPYDLWNYPNNGSSTSSYSETYRGTAPFSEPETAAVRDFANAKNFRTALQYHTYSNLLIYPWGYKDSVAHATFRTMAIEMTKINGYRYGTAPELLYAVRGVSDDWFYQEKKTFSLTPEAGSGSDGFWPSQSRIFPLAQENLEANLLLAEYAGQVRAED